MLLLKEREGAVFRGEAIAEGWRRLRFEDLADLALADYEVHQRKSADRAALALRRLGEMFVGRRVSTIGLSAVEGYILWRRVRNGVANATINRELAALRRGFSLAVRHGRYPESRVPKLTMLPEPLNKSSLADALFTDEQRVVL